MLVIGYRGNVDWSKVKAAIKRCTDMNSDEINKIVKQIRDGMGVNLQDDFVLNDELRDLGILIT